tara:strand:- start:1048 stop:3000 length:1953 start_codon:yes stop_codon:yes gene_type:complete
MRKNKINICLFSGGSGNQAFVQLLKNIPEIELNIIVNGYDDGKSTKELRRFGKEILGPSDFRKNLSHLMNLNTKSEIIMSKILNFRFPNKTSKINFVSFLELDKKNYLIKNLEIYELPYETLIKLKDYLSHFLKYYKKNNLLNIADISLGNLLIFASFLKNKRSFNKAISDIHNFFNIKKDKVLNVTDGENLYLYAILEDGKIIEDEDQLVNIKHKFPIEDIFLLPEKILPNKLKYLSKINKKNKLNFFNKYNRYPKINLEVETKLSQADIIIYGPGTQYSSLFPSYLTQNLRQSIENSKAKKFLITNIFLDNDIINENVEDIISKFNFFFQKNSKSKLRKPLINYYLINKYDQDDVNLLKKDNYLLYDKKKNFTLLDWEKSEGLHYPNWLAKKIFSLSKKKQIIKSLPKSVLSIVIPCLNEKKKIGKVLSKIQQLKINNFDLILDVIIVDGGSNDGSINVIKKYKDFKFYKLKNAGKGEAIKYGINKSKGDIILFFPSDDEYKVDDIEKVITPILLGQSKAVYGSRMIKTLALTHELQKIYKKDKTNLILSKYGGKLINLFLFAFHEISISDPFTSIKAFDSKILKSIPLYRRGFDLEFEILTKLKKRKCFFLEVPVSFKPRTLKDGKKISISEGVKCLFYLIFSKFYK